MLLFFMMMVLVVVVVAVQEALGDRCTDRSGNTRAGSFFLS